MPPEYVDRYAGLGCDRALAAGQREPALPVRRADLDRDVARPDRRAARRRHRHRPVHPRLPARRHRAGTPRRRRPTQAVPGHARAGGLRPPGHRRRIDPGGGRRTGPGRRRRPTAHRRPGIPGRAGAAGDPPARRRLTGDDRSIRRGGDQRRRLRKLDYYLGRRLSYNAESCANGQRTATVGIALTNNAPASGLPDYVVTRADKPAQPFPRGQTRLWLSYFGTAGAGFTRATLDGAPANLQSETERGHPVFSTYLTLDPGQTRTLALTLIEPAAAGTMTTLEQPIVEPQQSAVRLTPCTTG